MHGKEDWSMTLAEEKIYTIDDIYKLPEGERAQLFDGQMYMMAPPSREHQQLVSELNYVIKDYIKKKRGDCQVYPAPFAVFLNADNKNYVEPDLSIICDKNKLDHKGCYGAPDWIIEIVSPSSRQIDYYRKLYKYQNAGVREYWIVDKEKNRIIVHNFEKETGEEYTFEDIVPAGIYEEFSVNFKEINL